MNNLKKKISIILFKQQLKKNDFLFLLPSIAIKKSNSSLKLLHGIKFIFLKNQILTLATSNLVYTFLKSKVDLLKLITQYKKNFFGLKVKNLYFSFRTLQKFNYLKFFIIKNFISNLKTFYFYFLRYIFILRKKIK